VPARRVHARLVRAACAPAARRERPQDRPSARAPSTPRPRAPRGRRRRSCRL